MAASRSHLDPEDFVESCKLVVDQANADELLQLLNEDLFLGGLTGDRFRSGGARKRCDGSRQRPMDPARQARDIYGHSW